MTVLLLAGASSFSFFYVVYSEAWLLEQVMIFFLFLAVVFGNRFSGLCLMAKSGAMQQKRKVVCVFEHA